jgi:hypothetical protein
MNSRNRGLFLASAGCFMGSDDTELSDPFYPPFYAYNSLFKEQIFARLFISLPFLSVCQNQEF